MKLTPTIAIALWKQAASPEVEIGIAVKTNNRRELSRVLYETRQQAADPELNKIIMMMPAKSDEIFLCKKMVSLPEAEFSDGN